MSEFQTGDVLISPNGFEWEVLAFHLGPEGKEWYWMSDGDQPFAVNAGTVKGWRVKPDFFEEKKNYRYGEGQVVSIWYVLDLARGPVAVGQTTDSTPCMMTDFHGWHEVR